MDIKQLEYLKHHKTDTLYINDTPKGKFIKTVWEMDVTQQIKLALQVFYVQEKGDISDYRLVKIKKGKEDSEVILYKFDLEKIAEFNSLLSSIDIKNTSSKKLSLSEFTEGVDFKNINLSKETLSQLQNNETLEKDIVAVAYKRKIIEVFKDALTKWKSSFSKINISSSSEEKAWQDFFMKNQWIFGYGLDYKFNSILVDEAHISSSNLQGKNSVITDFLLGDGLFTTLVELKKPSTKLFAKQQNRSNTWRLSNELLEAYSQILTQKAESQLKLSNNNYDNNQNLIKEDTIDPKVILVIGSWQEIESDNDETRKIKKQTFELFRRDSRNVEILTYDELLKRAEFIVKHLDNESNN